MTYIVGPNIYANNRHSLALIEPDTAAVLLMCTGKIHDASRALPAAVRDADFGASQESSKSPLMYFFYKSRGFEGNWFSYLNSHVSPLEP